MQAVQIVPLSEHYLAFVICHFIADFPHCFSEEVPVQQLMFSNQVQRNGHCENNEGEAHRNVSKGILGKHWWQIM